MNLYSCQSSKPLRPDEFDQTQAAATDATANHLRDNWLAAVKHVIKCGRTRVICRQGRGFGAAMRGELANRTHITLAGTTPSAGFSSRT